MFPSSFLGSYHDRKNEDDKHKYFFLRLNSFFIIFLKENKEEMPIQRDKNYSNEQRKPKEKI